MKSKRLAAIVSDSSRAACARSASVTRAAFDEVSALQSSKALRREWELREGRETFRAWLRVRAGGA